MISNRTVTKDFFNRPLISRLFLQLTFFNCYNFLEPKWPLFFPQPKAQNKKRESANAYIYM